jgi:hypothetical protein
MAQIIPRGEATWTIRIYLGRTLEGRRRFHNTTVHGSREDAEKYVALYVPTLAELPDRTLRPPRVARGSKQDALTHQPPRAARTRPNRADSFHRALKAHSLVYFIQCRSTKLIKIGVSTGFEDRLRAIRNVSPTEIEALAVTPGSQRTEYEFHNHFRGARERTEWFRPVPKLLLKILDLRAAHPEQLHILKSVNAELSPAEGDTLWQVS